MRYLFYSFLLITGLSFSQENKATQEHATVFITKKALDCKDAVFLNLTKATSCNYINSPKGFGIQEIKSNNKTDKVFEQEHNSTWYLLSAKNDGKLIFEILPIDSTNDYDFLLYRYTDSTFCSNLLNRKIAPLRGNLSIPPIRSDGKTGLSSKATMDFTDKSLGAMFSKPIKVKEGEKYMLIVDNVTPNGKGYGIAFNCINKIIISGKITDSSKQPIKTVVTLMDRNNNEVAKVNADGGNYKITAEVKEEVDYSLLFYNDSYLPMSAIVNTSMIDTNIDILTIDKVMPKLKVGQTYNLLYFHQTSILLNVEGAAILGLAQLMKKNPKMKIQIQGHAAKYELTKNPMQANGGFKIDPTIAKERADYVYGKLLQKGIAKERMEQIGLSSDRPLFPNPSSEEEINKNKRVSIKILSL
jgi:outer membrane protein OmpA-like peptidoglycan-associated protein